MRLQGKGIITIAENGSIVKAGKSKPRRPARRLDSSDDDAEPEPDAEDITEVLIDHGADADSEDLPEYLTDDDSAALADPIPKKREKGSKADRRKEIKTSEDWNEAVLGAIRHSKVPVDQCDLVLIFQTDDGTPQWRVSAKLTEDDIEQRVNAACDDLLFRKGILGEDDDGHLIELRTH